MLGLHVVQTHTWSSWETQLHLIGIHQPSSTIAHSEILTSSPGKGLHPWAPKSPVPDSFWSSAASVVLVSWPPTTTPWRCFPCPTRWFWPTPARCWRPWLPPSSWERPGIAWTFWAAPCASQAGCCCLDLSFHVLNMSNHLGRSYPVTNDTNVCGIDSTNHWYFSTSPSRGNFLFIPALPWVPQNWLQRALGTLGSFRFVPNQATMAISSATNCPLFSIPFRFREINEVPIERTQQTLQTS